MSITPILVFVFGSIVGSFLNAVIFRLSKNITFVSGRSICVHCHHTLSPKDLIPVLSYIVLGGKCRYCRKKISIQYPLVELLSGFIFVLAFLQFGITISFLWACIFASFLIIVGVYDFLHLMILDNVLWVFGSLALLKNILLDLSAPDFSLSNSITVEGLLAALIISGFFAAQYYISQGRWIGFGDVKFGIVFGLLFGIKIGLIALVLAYFIGAVAGILLLIFGGKKLESKLPLGTFLSISAIIMLYWGGRISDWYFHLIAY